VDTGLTAKRMMVKARAAGAEAIEVLIKEMRGAPRASERLTAAGMLLRFSETHVNETPTVGAPPKRASLPC
jgi:hypothetical protein